MRFAQHVGVAFVAATPSFPFCTNALSLSGDNHLAKHAFMLTRTRRTTLFLLSSCTDSENPTTDVSKEEETISEEPLDPLVCQDFRINVCASTSCAQKRKTLGLDEFATFSGIYTRAAHAGDGVGGSTTIVEVEESTCIGSCKYAPCVSVEHEDFVGTVGLDGMTGAELSARAFHSIITEEDMDRVWDSVENAIRTMAEENQEDTEEETEINLDPKD